MLDATHRISLVARRPQAVRDHRLLAVIAHIVVAVAVGATWFR